MPISLNLTRSEAQELYELIKNTPVMKRVASDLGQRIWLVNEFPYRVYLNDTLYATYARIDYYTVVGLGAGLREKNTVTVYYHGKVVWEFDTEGERIVFTRYEEPGHILV